MTTTERLTASLKGKKTNLISAWAFCGALYMWMNGIGEVESAAILGTVATLAAAMRAGIAKNGNAVLILAVGASFMFLGGCAALGVADPATGTSPAEDIVAAAGTAAALFGPVVGTAVPVGIGSILSILIALGKSKDE